MRVESWCPYFEPLTAFDNEGLSLVWYEEAEQDQILGPHSFRVGDEELCLEPGDIHPWLVPDQHVLCAQYLDQ